MGNSKAKRVILAQLALLIPLAVSFFHPAGFIAKFKGTYIDQKGSFQSQVYEPGVFLSGKDQFWLVDASVGYRLPKRYGLITLEAHNIFNQSFMYYDTDPVNPLIQPERYVFLKFTLSF